MNLSRKPNQSTCGWTAILLTMLCLVISASKVTAQTDAPTTPPGLTLSGTYSSVKTLLTEIDRRDGGQRKLRARNSSGWPRVQVYAHNASSEKVLGGIASLFNYRWNSSRGYPAPPGEPNLLGQTERARAFEDRLWREHLIRAAAPLFQIAKYTRTKPAEWKKRLDALKGAKPEDPLLRGGILEVLATPFKHAQLELLDTLSFDQRQTLIREEQIVVPGGGITTRQWEALRRMDQIPGPRYEWLPGESDRLLSEKEVQDNLARKFEFHRWAGLTMAIERDPGNGAILRYAPWLDLSHLPPTMPPFPVRGCPYPADAAVKMSVSPQQNQDEVSKANAVMPFPAAFKFPTPAKGEEVTWSEVMKALGKSLPENITLLSDDFEAAVGLQSREALPITMPPDLSGKTLEDGLDTLCASQGRLWWREGNTLFFRSQTWFVKQRYQVPPPVMARLNYLAAQLEAFHRDKNVMATLVAEVVTTLGDLTREQFIGLLAGRATQVSYHQIGAWEARQAQPYLQLFQILNASQQRQLLDGEGVPLEDMTAAQRQALVGFAAGYVGVWVTRKTDQMRFTASVHTRVKKANQVLRLSGEIEDVKSGEVKTEPCVIVTMVFGFLPNASHSTFGMRLPYAANGKRDDEQPPARDRIAAP